MAERKQARNIYYDHFAERFEFYNRMPYAPIAADWKMLNDLLQNSGKLSERMSMEVWKRGVENYLTSEFGTYSLKHLCSEFVSFWNGPQDRYGKPKQKASQVGGETPSIKFETWHPRFLHALFKINNKHTSDAIDQLLEDVVDLSEIEAFKRLKEIETLWEKSRSQSADASAL